MQTRGQYGVSSISAPLREIEYELRDATMIRLSLITVALAVFSTMSEPAYAYLDPGTGSLLLQGLIAAILGALYAIKLYWIRLKEFFLRLFHKGRKLEHISADSSVEKDVDS